MLNKIRKRVSPLLNQTFMNRYTDDSLLKLFNEVAYSNNMKYHDVVNLSKLGYVT